MIRPFRFHAAAAALALAVGAAGAASAERGHHSHYRPSLERAVEALALDAATSARLDAVLEAAKAEKRELYRSLREKHDALRALLADTASTEDAALAEAEAIGQLQTELRKQQLRTLYEVRAQLSPEQQQQLAAALGERERRGKHGKSCGKKDGKQESESGSEDPGVR